MKILVLNSGSSSLKYQFIDITTEEAIVEGICERIGMEGSVMTYKVPEKEEKEKKKKKKNWKKFLKNLNP